MARRGLQKIFVGRVDGYKVYFVNGGWVRNRYDYNFLLGGHHYAHRFIPKNEIWLEPSTDWKFILFHELIELPLMRKGMSYKRAHAAASRAELAARRKAYA